MIAAFLLGMIAGAVGMMVFADWWHKRNRGKRYTDYEREDKFND